MSDFTGDTEVRAIDLLTLIVWLGTDPDPATVVRVYVGNSYGAPPTLRTVCLRCLSHQLSFIPAPLDGADKAVLVRAAKHGRVYFIELGVPQGQCPKCHPERVMSRNPFVLASSRLRRKK